MLHLTILECSEEKSEKALFKTWAHNPNIHGFFENGSSKSKKHSLLSEECSVVSSKEFNSVRNTSKIAQPVAAMPGGLVL